MTYRGFPERLHHGVPHWVEPGALFQIRIALDCEKKQKALIDPTVGAGDSGFCKVLSVQDAVAYHAVSPDARSLHALLSFARDKSMSEVIRGWKRFHKRVNRVMWQEGYFDHRLRADERGTQLSAKMNYIR